MHDPQLVILDEPTAGVDPIGAAAIADIVRELKRRGKTVLLCSHLLAQIEGIREGRIEDLVQEEGVESLVVRGLSDGGRAAVEKAIADLGGELARVEQPRMSLDALFLEEVRGRESAREERMGKEDHS